MSRGGNGDKYSCSCYLCLVGVITLRRVALPWNLSAAKRGSCEDAAR